MRRSNVIYQKYFRKDPDAFWINENGKWRARSVHYGDGFRYTKALDEAKKNPAPVKHIIRYCNEFLSGIGISPVADPMMEPDKVDYAQIKKQYQLNDKRDLIWLKFVKGNGSQAGHIGCVAQGADINFQIPPNAEAYNYKDKSQRWLYNTSGIIVHKLGMRWDTSFVLVFPLRLQHSNSHYNRHEIETGIGNYLIDMGLPILDYYSHNY